jgi:HEAT repeat protein
MLFERFGPATRRVAALVACSSLALAAPCAPTRAAAAHEPSDAARAELVSVLSASVAGRRAPLGVIEDLGRLDPALVGELFEALHRRSVPIDDAHAAQEEGLDDVAAPGPRLALGPREEGVLRVALARIETGTLRAFLEELADGDADVERRTTALVVLGDAGSLRDVRLMARLATPPPDAQGVRRARGRALRDAFERSLGAVLLRDAGSWGSLVDAYRSVATDLRHPIARALAETGDERALSALAGFLRRAPELDALVLHELSGMVAEHGLEADELVLASVRGSLTGRPDVAVQAAGALGALGDEEALPELVELLRHGDANVRAAAGRALQTITGLRLGCDARAWSTWLARERKSRMHRLDRLATELRGGEPRAVAAALNELARLRTGRAEVAELVANCLAHDEPDVVRMACAALSQLRQTTSLAELAPCLEHADPAVREAAWSALKRISGLDVPPERAAWHAALAGR